MARERGPGALEREILASLAAHRQPMTPAEVLADVGVDLAYTTVMTTLSRLHAKRALVREPRGRAYAYSLPDSPTTARASMIAFHMQRLLDGQEDHAGVLTQFVANLERDDEVLLQRLLGRTDTPTPTDTDTDSGDSSGSDGDAS